MEKRFREAENFAPLRLVNIFMLFPSRPANTISDPFQKAPRQVKKPLARLFFLIFFGTVFLSISFLRRRLDIKFIIAFFVAARTISLLLYKIRRFIVAPYGENVDFLDYNPYYVVVAINPSGWWLPFFDNREKS